MSALRRTPPLVFPSSARHTATVIFLHGLGDSGDGWASAVENWRLRSRLNQVKFVLPNAPQIPITCNMGMRMPGWYDIYELGGASSDLRRRQDEAGLIISRDYVRGLIQAEIDAGIPADRIVLGGFSQGGATALLTGLTAKAKLGGVVALSSYLPLDSKIAELLLEDNHNQQTPIFMGHGSADPVVPTSFGQQSSEILKKMGFDVQFRLYPGMGHSVVLDELDHVEAFLAQRLSVQ